MRAVDTNVVVRLLVGDDPRQTAAAESFVAEGAWVPVVALMEAIWVLESVYELDSKAQARGIRMLLDHRELVLDGREIVAAALELFVARPSLGFSDCFVIESARRAGHLPLGTFDRRLARVAGAERI